MDKTNKLYTNLYRFNGAFTSPTCPLSTKQNYKKNKNVFAHSVIYHNIIICLKIVDGQHQGIKEVYLL